MDLKLNNKIAVITGGSKGIGKAIALALAKEGCGVVIAAREEGALKRAADEIRDAGGKCLALSVDLSKAEEIQKLVDTTLETWGTVDILVNNLGGIHQFAPFENILDQDWLDMFHLNVFSNVKVIRAFLPIMQKNKSGRIINISSEVALQPDPKAVHYSAAKACINSITKSLAKSYCKDGVLINAVSPSFTLTKEIEERIIKLAEKSQVTPEHFLANLMKERSEHAINRPAKAEEVASLVVYLSSEQASFITGANFRVDGGAVENI